MTLHRLIQNLAFNQDDIERLAAAYEEALLALHISDRDDPINKVIAQRIIEGARAGERDPNTLCQIAIKDLMIPRLFLRHPIIRRVAVGGARAGVGAEGGGDRR